MAMNRRLFGLALGVTGVMALAGCATAPVVRLGSVRETPYGVLPDGRPVRAFDLTGANGMTARIIEYGAIVVSLTAPDRNGVMGDVVLGLDTLEDYVERNRNFGTIVGRYAGRIAGGRFQLDGETIHLDTGGGAHSSHGGPEGFARRLWRGEAIHDHIGPGVRLTLISPDGDQGFPGELTTEVIYRLTPGGALRIDMTATTTRPTVINLTHHGYFNLTGDGSRSVLDHELMMAADAFTPFDENKVVTGEIRPVAGTPFDFREAKPIGRDIDADEEQIRIGNGYDHNFVVRGAPGDFRLASWSRDPSSGRVMELHTTAPGVQLYTANAIRDWQAKGGVVYQPRTGFCLEPQHYQDSPNRPEFPSTVLRPGQTYRQRHEYRFGVQG
jgi:aldose 1-epimerase